MATLSGLLLSISWPYTGSITPLIFFAFIPLLLIEDKLFKQGKYSFWSAYKYGYPAFLIFNIITTYWIYNVDESLGTKLFSAGSAIILNAAFMNVAFALFHVTRSRIGSKEGYIGLLIYWLSWEYLHLNWELSWPWLTFGNVFSLHPEWIQWYSYTGILGGSLFIMLINIFFFFAIQSHISEERAKRNRYLILILFSFLVSILFSFYSRNSIPVDGKAMEIVLVQPNIDPYNEKFDLESSDVRLLKMLEQAESMMTEKTKLILFPETSLQERTTLYPKNDSIVYIGLWENDIEQSNSLREIRRFLDKYPSLTMIFGMSSDRVQDEDEEISNASRYIESMDIYYQAYNAAIIVTKDNPAQFYHKSELVPAVEFMPFQWLLEPISSLAIDMGGTTGTLGTQEEQVPFFTLNDSIGVSAAICYESIYGKVSNEFVQNGAQVLGIITNDGWWEDSPGYKQHLSYARLRAIECRKWVARCANTGISCFINPEGEILQQSDWWVEATLRGEVYPNSEMTFYVRYGNYIGRTAAFVSVLLLIYTLVQLLRKKEQKLKAS